MTAHTSNADGAGGKIISASRRTDIPAFYAEWLVARLRAGEVVVRNPFNRQQVRRVALRPEDVAALVFWTRNPAPLFKHWSCLAAYRHVWLMTITGLPAQLEPAVPKPAQAVALLRRLSDKVGAARVVWRFDPVFITPLAPPQRLLDTFDHLAGQLQPFVARAVLSFADIYGKVPSNAKRAGITFSDVRAQPGLLHDLAREFKRIADHHRLPLQSCAETLPELPQGACIDGQWLNELFGLALPLRKDPGQRAACRCVSSIDIGAYNTCGHGCVYCYATTHTTASRTAWRRQAVDAEYLGS